MRLPKILPFLLFGALLLITKNFEITDTAWKMFPLFAATILALILKSASMGTISIISLTIGAGMNAFTIQEAIAGFGTSIVWQVVIVFFIAAGFVKTGLAERISYHIIKFFGKKNVLGLGYGFTLSNFVLGPLIPSSGARIGGIIFPIIKSISEILGSDPKNNTEKKVGSFFMLICLYSNAIVAATFLTAMAGNFVIKSLALSASNINITWIDWFLYSSVPSIICLLTMPYILYKIHPPEIKEISQTRELIDTKLKELGRLSKKEKQMIIILGGVLFGWIFGEQFKIDVVLVALAGLSACLMLNILDFEKDILEQKEAWHLLVWLSVLLFMTRALESSGFLDKIILNLDTMLNGFSWPIALVFLIIIYAYTQYIFASNSSHISAMYSIFLIAGIKLGVPALLVAFSLAFASSLSAGLYYYTSTEAIILYNSKYINNKDFFIFGLIMTTYLLVTWMGVGSIWWKFLGMY